MLNLLIKGVGNNQLNPLFRQQSHTLFQRAKIQTTTLSPNNGNRVRIKGQDGRASLFFSGCSNHLLEQRLMAPMDTIKNANGYKSSRSFRNI
jgi:hypothetical protein